MSTNELGVHIPAEVVAEATRMGCRKGIKYVYLDGNYPTNGPATSIDCVKRSSRLTADDIDALKVSLLKGFVAFRSRASLACSLVFSPQPNGQLPPLPPSRVGKITCTTKIDGSPLIFKVIEDHLFIAPSNSKKAYLLQKVQVDDGNGVDNGHFEYRIAYYMIGHKKRALGRWAFGQFAPIMTAEDLRSILRVMEEKNWLNKEQP